MGCSSSTEKSNANTGATSGPKSSPQQKDNKRSVNLTISKDSKVSDGPTSTKQENGQNEDESDIQISIAETKLSNADRPFHNYTDTGSESSLRLSSSLTMSTADRRASARAKALLQPGASTHYEPGGSKRQLLSTGEQGLSRSQSHPDKDLTALITTTSGVLIPPNTRTSVKTRASTNLFELALTRYSPDMQQVIKESRYNALPPETATPYLGMHLTETSEGIEVQRVVEEGPAAIVGILPGDVITALDGTDITHEMHLEEFLDIVKKTCRVGSVVSLCHLRGMDEFQSPIWVMTTDKDQKGKSYFFDDSMNRSIGRRSNSLME